MLHLKNYFSLLILIQYSIAFMASLFIRAAFPPPNPQIQSLQQVWEKRGRLDGQTRCSFKLTFWLTAIAHCTQEAAHVDLPLELLGPHFVPALQNPKRSARDFPGRRPADKLSFETGPCALPRQAARPCCPWVRVITHSEVNIEERNS